MHPITHPVTHLVTYPITRLLTLSPSPLRLILVAFAVALLSLPIGVRAQGSSENGSALLDTVLNSVASVPLSLQFGDENLFGPRVGLRVGGSLYPVPLVLQRELNLDASADLTYTLRATAGGALARASAALYTGAGPRYRLVNSELFLAGDAPGTYLGVGGVAGAEFRLSAIGLSLVSAFAEAGTDYIWQTGEAVETGRLSPRVRVGLGIPFFSAP